MCLSLGNFFATARRLLQAVHDRVWPFRRPFRPEILSGPEGALPCAASSSPRCLDCCRLAIACSHAVAQSDHAVKPTTHLAAVTDYIVGEPIRHKNLTIFPVLSKVERKGDRYTTLDEGLRAGTVQVIEGRRNAFRKSLCCRLLPPHNRGKRSNGRRIARPGPPQLLKLSQTQRTRRAARTGKLSAQ